MRIINNIVWSLMVGIAIVPYAVTIASITLYYAMVVGYHGYKEGGLPMALMAIDLYFDLIDKKEVNNV